MEKNNEMATPTIEQLQAEIEELKEKNESLNQLWLNTYNRETELRKKLQALKDIVEVVVGKSI